MCLKKIPRNYCGSLCIQNKELSMLNDQSLSAGQTKSSRRLLDFVYTHTHTYIHTHAYIHTQSKIQIQSLLVGAAANSLPSFLWGFLHCLQLIQPMMHVRYLAQLHGSSRCINWQYWEETSASTAWKICWKSRMTVHSLFLTQDFSPRIQWLTNVSFRITNIHFYAMSEHCDWKCVISPKSKGLLKKPKQ